MVIEASRYVRRSDTVLVGSGAPLAVCSLARMTHAADASYLLDTGAIDPAFRRAPISITDHHATHHTSRHGSLREVLGGLLQGGRVDLAVLGAAQVDRFGNLNSSYLISSSGERRRLPGSGGANAMTSHAHRILIVVPHERRRFPDRCDYVSSPGYVDGPHGRAASGLPPHRPEIVVVTTACVMVIDRTVGELTVEKLMPGVSASEIRARTGFVVRFSASAHEVETPAPAELKILREIVDPDGIYTGAAPPPRRAAGS